MNYMQQIPSGGANKSRMYMMYTLNSCEHIVFLFHKIRSHNKSIAGGKQVQQIHKHQDLGYLLKEYLSRRVANVGWARAWVTRGE